MTPAAYEYFIIRHKPTGGVITPAKGREGRGGSHVEPNDGRPRLFNSERAAKGWLTSWLKGKVTSEWRYGAEEPDLEVTPVPTRKREEMEIVKMRLAA